MADYHRITWLMIGCGVAGFAVNVLSFTSKLATNYRLGPNENVVFDALTQLILDGGWSLGFFGSAFTVEFLHRIWKTLRAMPSETAARVGND